MNGYKYRGKRIQLEQLFKILTQRFVSVDENRSSLQQFNALVENSWKLTINKYKEIRTSNCSSETDYNNPKESSEYYYKSKFVGENSYVNDRLSSGCYWNASTGIRIPMVDLSKY